MPPEFTKDWFTARRRNNFAEHLLSMAGEPELDFLELGSFEGKSAIWMLENVLTHPTSHLWCVDYLVSESPAEQWSRLTKNLEPWRGRVDIVFEETSTFLKRLPRGPRFRFAYVDASHKAPNVLEDAILSWPLVLPGGLVFFDDYGSGPVRVALDAFMNVCQGCYNVVFQNWQLGLQKIKDW